MPPQDPDASLVVMFKNHAILNEAKTASEGRPIYDDMEIVEVRFPGSRNVSVFPAVAMSHWSSDQYGGNQVKVSYAERFAHQYRQFKMHAAQTKAGTPLTYAPFLTEARRAELRAQNIYTVEALAGIDGQELKNLGHNGRDLKNRAEAYILESKEKAAGTQAAAEIEALKARNELLEEDMKRLKEAQPVASPDTKFDGMTNEQLCDYIAAHTDHRPKGDLNRKVLERMARECQPKAA
jgi:hypothetical protein